MKIVRVISCDESETLEVHWYLKDKTVWISRYTITPKATREYGVWNRREHTTESSSTDAG